MILAVDVGGSGLRAGLVDADGRVRHRHAVPGAVGTEADPALWWDALHQAVHHLAAPASDLTALCITGMTRTQVLLNGDGRPVRPALTFRDSRAAALDPALDAYHPAARLLWVARHEPQLLSRVAAVVDPKDYLAAQLTGRIASDAVSGRLLAEPGLLARLGLPDVRPALLQPGVVLAPVRPGLPGALGRLSGLPVVMAGHDTWACAVGLGALRDGGAYNLSGTTEVLGVLSATRREAPGLITAEWGDGLWQLGGPSNAGGGTLAWAERLLGAPLDTLLRQPPAPDPPLFLPYLEGERTPHWDPALRGAFLGLDARHRPADLAWAVLEGVACLNRMVLLRAGGADMLRFGGGGAGSAAWCQMKADVLGIPIETVQEPEAGLLGAAITAWAALGAVPSRAAGQAAMVRVGQRTLPRPERRAFHDRRFAAYCAADAAVAPISHLLAKDWD